MFNIYQKLICFSRYLHKSGMNVIFNKAKFKHRFILHSNKFNQKSPANIPTDVSSLPGVRTIHTFGHENLDVFVYCVVMISALSKSRQNLSKLLINLMQL